MRDPIREHLQLTPRLMAVAMCARLGGSLPVKGAWSDAIAEHGIDLVDDHSAEFIITTEQGQTFHVGVTEQKPSARLVLERKDQPDQTAQVGPVSITPPIGEGYWLFRVKVSDKQAVVGFPKFGTIGVGFAVEADDWNTNLPYTCGTEEIYEHIECNKGDDAISRDTCVAAIKLVQDAAAELMTKAVRS